MTTTTIRKPESILDRAAGSMIHQAELGRVPDWLIRAGMDRVISSRLASEESQSEEERRDFLEAAWNGPIAINTSDANRQHYEVPGEYFDLLLGPRRKYSSALWDESVRDLETAENAMLALVGERAELSDGQMVLDLGCGWGSFVLWAAEHFPNSEVVGVSNSAGQRRHILRLAEEAGLANVEVMTADINEFDPGRSFDRIVSVEMLEHVRNHRELFRRASRWVRPDGAMFIHVFSHRDFSYPYEVEGPGSWMADTFFTGGMMPSHHLLPTAADPFFETEAEWRLSGVHYMRTLEAWLDRLDSNRADVRQILEPVYGEAVDIWLQRWRMFLMASSQMFGYRSGSQWGVSHYRLRPRSSGV